MRLGTDAIKDIRLGSAGIKKVLLGTSLVWEKAGPEFVMTVRVPSDNEVVTLPTQYDLDFDINWGDGVTEHYDVIDTFTSHTYALAGDYTIRIDGLVEGIDYSAGGTAQHPVHLHNLGDLGYTSLHYFFKGCTNLISFTAGYHVFTGTSMTHMLEGCVNLEYVDFKGFDFSHILYTDYTFKGCTKLPKIDLGWVEFSGMRGISHLFEECNSLSDLTLPRHFVGPNITNISSTFRGCHELTTINTSNWDTSNVTLFRSFARDCTKLVNLNTYNIEVDKATHIDSFIKDCPVLEEINTSNWVVDSVTDMHDFAANCFALQTWDTSGWVTAGNPDCEMIAYKCHALTSTMNADAFWLNTNITSHTSAFTEATNIPNFADIPADWK